MLPFGAVGRSTVTLFPLTSSEPLLCWFFPLGLLFPPAPRAIAIPAPFPRRREYGSKIGVPAPATRSGCQPSLATKPEFRPSLSTIRDFRRFASADAYHVDMMSTCGKTSIRVSLRFCASFRFPVFARKLCGRLCAPLAPALLRLLRNQDAPAACILPSLAAFRSRRSPAAADVPVGRSSLLWILSTDGITRPLSSRGFGFPAPRAIALSSMFIAAGSSRRAAQSGGGALYCPFVLACGL